METAMYTPSMAKRVEDKDRTELGKRLVMLRTRTGMSQVQLAKAIGLPQRTIANYETIANYIPSTVLASLADALGVTIEEIVGLPTPKGGKRGPKSRLERQFDAVRRLPKREQDLALELLERLVVSAS